MAGFHVLMNPGDILCCHGRGGGHGGDPVAQFLCAFELTLQSLGALRRFRGLFPFLRDPFRLAFEHRHAPVGLLPVSGQLLLEVLRGPGQAFLLLLHGRVEFCCALGWPHLVLPRVGLALAPVRYLCCRGCPTIAVGHPDTIKVISCVAQHQAQGVGFKAAPSQEHAAK